MSRHAVPDIFVRSNPIERCNRDKAHTSRLSIPRRCPPYPALHTGWPLPGNCPLPRSLRNHRRLTHPSSHTGSWRHKSSACSCRRRFPMGKSTHPCPEPPSPTRPRWVAACPPIGTRHRHCPNLRKPPGVGHSRHCHSRWYPMVRHTSQPPHMPNIERWLPQSCQYRKRPGRQYAPAAHHYPPPRYP